MHPTQQTMRATYAMLINQMRPVSDPTMPHIVPHVTLEQHFALLRLGFQVFNNTYQRNWESGWFAALPCVDEQSKPYLQVVRADSNASGIFYEIDAIESWLDKESDKTSIERYGKESA